MAQQPQTQHRPTINSPSPSFSNSYPQPNGRQFSPHSPPAVSAPSPLSQTSFSPPYNADAPPAKRPRMSPETPTSSSTPQPSQTPNVTSTPVNGQPNGISPSMVPRPGSMPPPQYPAIKKENENEVGFLSGIQTAAGPQPPFQQSHQLHQPQHNPLHPQQAQPQPPQQQQQQKQSPPAPPLNMRNLPPQQNTQTTTFSPSPSTPGPGPSPMPNGTAPTPTPQLPPIDPVVKEKREHERQDWEESRFAQHELWDPFLFGATLNEKIKQAAARANLSELQNGVLVNTQKNQPPPRVRVQGLEGASKVIDKGQSILNTENKAERLNDLVKLLSLSARARLTGLVQAAARTSLERRAHFQGRIPSDWSDVAVPVVPNESDPQEQSADAAPGTGMKRTHSQANNDDAASVTKSKSSPHPAVAAFVRLSSQEEKAERKRQAKRRKRTEITTAQEAEAAEKAEAEAVAAALEAEKKTTKKERKMAESKVSEQQQHASTNEAARMATASLLGRGVGGKKKRYDWMLGGGGAGSRPASGSATPARSMSTATVPKDKPTESTSRSRLGDFDDSKETGIRALDLLAILESDGRAARQFVRGSSTVDESANRMTDS